MIPEFEAEIKVRYNSMEISTFKIKVHSQIIGLKKIVKNFHLTLNKNDNFESILCFKNFSLKFGYSTPEIKIHDIILISAKGLKISFYFKENKKDRIKYNLTKHLEKFCIKSNLLRHYRVEKPLGKGGFATVYLMQRKSDHKEFAVKLIKKHTINKPKELRYLLSEIDILRIADHPNIVKTYEVHELDKYVAIVQEYLDGGSLRNYIREEEKDNEIQEYDVIQIIHELLLAIHYIHKMGYLHRDLKPGNVMLRKRSSRAKDSPIFKAKYDVILIDFGLCARADDFGENSFLKDRSGTVGYLAPELIEKGYNEWYDQKVDVYSLGIVMVEL